MTSKDLKLVDRVGERFAREIGALPVVDRCWQILCEEYEKLFQKKTEVNEDE